MSISIRAMQISDYAEVAALWRCTEGIGLNESDSESAVAAFLERNHELSAVALAPAGGIAGALLCGHDGRRGYLHHLAVARAHRGRGVARSLLAWAYRGLARHGIQKCNIFLFDDNAAGAAFWRHDGWVDRADLVVFQRPIAAAPSEPARPRAVRS